MNAKGMAVRAYVLAADAAALVAYLTAPAAQTDRPWTATLLVVLSGVVGWQPVRFSSLRTTFAATDPLILCALAACGPRTAILVALAGVLGSALGADRRESPLKFAFNVGGVGLAAAAAGWAFQLCGGRSGSPLGTLLGPLAAATALFFLANSALVSAAVALEQRQPLWRAWTASFGWSVATYFAGLSLAAALLIVLEAAGPWGLLLGLPPTWLLVAFFRTHQARLLEKEQRISEVERLNGQLEHTVAELQQALAHVKQLQGLLPICMHCKRIRDDRDVWHRIESYLAQHTDVSFTHSLCEDCRDVHYPRYAGPPVKVP